MYDVLSFTIDVLLPIALLIGWLLAEFHSRRSIPERSQIF